MRSGIVNSVASTIVLGLLCLPVALAHGGSEEGHGDSMDMGNMKDEPKKDDSEYPPTYFAHPEHGMLIYSHIAIMVLSWVFVLPVAVMLSLARSKFTLLVQLVFFAANGLGVLLGLIYNAQTPDLYPNNAHHKIGWIITAVISAQIFIGLIGWVAGAVSSRRRSYTEEQAFIPVATDAAEAQSPRRSFFGTGYRLSDDSGHGTEQHAESTRSNSVSSNDDEAMSMEARRKEYTDEDDDLESMPLGSPLPGQSGTYAAKAAKVVSSRLWKYLDITYKIVDRIILPFGFIALATGVVTFARFFEGHGIFGGLAHWIKGGVFFWLGLLTLARWAGSFGEIGWAWNIRPKQDKWRPSAEFVESFLIFFYGSTNIFLEHLGGWGGEWSATDLEHMSITVLFIGGGLCGMLIESTRVRDLLNTTVTESMPEYPQSDEDRERALPPRTYEFSLNPIPALVILLLGVMMGSHTQQTMISSMVHKQWGNLLFGASLARGLTYLILYLKPPQSMLPSRPPTELLAAFGLIAGGIIFMASASDTVDGMIHYDLDAMFFYTVTMGCVGLLMAWELIVLAIKGWATRKERRALGRA